MGGNPCKTTPLTIQDIHQEYSWEHTHIHTHMHAHTHVKFKRKAKGFPINRPLITLFVDYVRDWLIESHITETQCICQMDFSLFNEPPT